VDLWLFLAVLPTWHETNIIFLLFSSNSESDDCNSTCRSSQYNILISVQVLKASVSPSTSSIYFYKQNVLLTRWLPAYGIFVLRFRLKKTAVFGCLTNALAPPPIALESCSRAQLDPLVLLMALGKNFLHGGVDFLWVTS